MHYSHLFCTRCFLWYIFFVYVLYTNTQARTGIYTLIFIFTGIGSPNDDGPLPSYVFYAQKIKINNMPGTGLPIEVHEIVPQTSDFGYLTFILTYILN